MYDTKKTYGSSSNQESSNYSGRGCCGRGCAGCTKFWAQKDSYS